MARIVDLELNHNEERSRSSEKYWRFGTALGVEVTQAQFFNATTSKRTKDLVNYRISQIEDLIRITQEQEKEFYNQLNLPANATQALKELQNRIDIWDSCGAGSLLWMSTAEQVYKEIGFDYENLSQDLENLFLDNKAVEQLIEDENFETKAKTIVIEQFNELAKQNNKIGFVIYKKGNRGLAKYIHKIEVRNGKIKIDFDPDTPTSYGQRISNLMRKEGYDITNSFVKDTSSTLGHKVWGIIEKYISKSSVKPFIKNQLFNTNLFKDYGMYANISAIKGALAEIYWNAAFCWILGSANATIPTGLLRNKGKQLNVDMIINGLGFQVKNYSISENGVIEFRENNKQAATLFTNRAEIEQPLLDILINFFASWSYNQIADSKNYKNAKEEYGPIYDKFAQGQNQVEAILQTHLDKIIGMERLASGDISEKMLDHLELNNNYYRNTFFLINNKIVPSSSILYAIKLSLEELSEAITLKVISMHTAPSGKLWPEEIHNVEQKKITYANKSRISYTVKLDISKILLNAYNYL